MSPGTRSLHDEEQKEGITSTEGERSRPYKAPYNAPNTNKFNLKGSLISCTSKLSKLHDFGFLNLKINFILFHFIDTIG